MSELTWQTEDARLATLIRNSVRVTVAVLLASVLVGWAVLSTIETGVRKMAVPEKKLLDRYPDLFAKPLGPSANELQSLGTLTDLESLIEIQRNKCNSLLSTADMLKNLGAFSKNLNKLESLQRKQNQE